MSDYAIGDLLYAPEQTYTVPSGSYTMTTFTAAQQGWQCPQCQTIWAPTVRSCEKCSPTSYTSFTTTGITTDLGKLAPVKKGKKK